VTASPLLIAGSIVALTVIASLWYAARHRSAAGLNLDEWAVGGRRFGTWIFWFVNAGEIYTTFALLGITGYAWAFGAPAYIAFTSVSLACTLGYWLMPRIWHAGRSGGLLTQADYFVQRYQARWLGAVVGIAGIIALIMYVQIQLTALSLVFRLTLGSALPAAWASSLAALLMLLFVYLAGLRSAAFAAGIKDVLMLVLVVILGGTVAAKVGADSMLDVFQRVQQLHPNIGHFPGLDAAAGLDTTWFVTAALNVALGTWIFPHMFQLCFAARDADTIRRNAIWQPLYSLSYFFIILLGFAALLAGTQPEGGNLNAVLLQFVADRYSPWLVGLLAGTVCLLALVPGSLLLLTAGSIFTRNVVAPLREVGERQAVWIARTAMIVFAACAVLLTLTSNESLVAVGLAAYGAIGMLAPGVFFGFLWPRTRAVAIATGMAAGYTALWWAPARQLLSTALPGWDSGLAAMLVNALVVAVITLAAPRRPAS
jgi:SSS family solute:Na+ symporter